MTEHVVVALDVGGTGMKCALVRPDGTVHHEERHPTLAARGPEAVTENILEIAAGLAAKARADALEPVAVGVAVPGVVDEENGVAVWSSNVGFRDVPLRSLIEEKLKLPAALGHDVRVGGIAEARLGAGKGERHVLFAAIGTGIAAALVVNGAGYNGAHGAAGELGHIIVRPGGPSCPCGQHGCLEAIASARAIGARYRELSGLSDASAFDVVSRINSDETARQVWHEAIQALADGMITAQALFDVSVLVLGGGLAEAGDTLLGPLKAAMERRVTFHRMPKIVKAALGDTAGCKGAALLALDHLEHSA
ncbi:ROK family protein [Actinoplanes subtropicus]|uniref:ROK family protein n=1 Tax=Actinoplanes subtropicus TaxID=543632 RepID=UPI0004C30C73|nr:ROK family protein [Actinoplanes subtropicus]